MPTRVAIADGHTLVRYGLRELLAQHADIEVVGECAAAPQARALAAAHRPDVVVLDIWLPGGDGLGLARELRGRHPGLGIVILSSRDEDTVLFRAAEAGASAFVSKAAPEAEVLAAIRHAAVAAGSFSSTGLAAALARRRRPPRMTLSGREAEVLRLLCDGSSVPAVALAMCISQSTAKTYVARLYEKLGASNRAQAVMTALRHGLMDASPRAA